MSEEMASIAHATALINAPSLINCNVLDLDRDLGQLIEAGIGTVHVDIMDAHYVPNIAFSWKDVAEIKERYPALTIDAHLMVTDPERHIERLAAAGADWITFPSDSTLFVRRTLGYARELGLRAGVAVNPSQPVEVVRPYARDLDHVNLLLVEPGFAGQRMLDGALDRVDELATIRSDERAGFAIEVDGGIDATVARECARRGAAIFVTGIYSMFEQPGGFAAAAERFAAEVFARDETPPGLAATS